MGYRVFAGPTAAAMPGRYSPVCASDKKFLKINIPPKIDLFYLDIVVVLMTIKAFIKMRYNHCIGWFGIRFTF